MSSSLFCIGGKERNSSLLHTTDRKVSNCWRMTSLTATFLAFVKLLFFILQIYLNRPMLSMSNVEMLINAFMTSKLDYCIALLGSCSAGLINKLQMVQNAASRVLTRTRKSDHSSPVLSTLHWLPIKHCIDFKFN